MIKIFAIDFSNYFESFSSVFAISLLILTIAFPILATRFVWKKHTEAIGSMQEEEFKMKWGSLTLELYVKSKMGLLFTMVFMGRRWILAFIIVALPRWSWLQV